MTRNRVSGGRRIRQRGEDIEFYRRLDRGGFVVAVDGVKQKRW